MVGDAVDSRLRNDMEVDEEARRARINLQNNPTTEFMSIVMNEVKSLVSEEVKQGVEAAKNSLSPTGGWGQNSKGKGKGKKGKGRGKGKGKNGKKKWNSNDGWQKNNSNNHWDGGNKNQNGGNGGGNGKKKWWN
eukprot:895367-Karenia_brevis.AAC.1